MKTRLIFFACFLLYNTMSAQTANFVWSGSIEYEKSVNMYSIIKKTWFGVWEKYYESSINAYKKAAQPQFKVLKSTLVFSTDKTLFTPDNEPEDKYSYTYYDSKPLVNQNNRIYTDLKAGKSIVQKVVYEETFVINDDIRKIKWKLTDETRDIAGYSCRRANGIMMDSIYVVAFYTGSIPISGGPESFGGLPGMILGVALPHENITWFAKKVIQSAATSTGIQVPVLPKKAKTVTINDLKKIIETSAVARWGKEYTQLYLKAFLL